MKLTPKEYISYGVIIILVCIAYYIPYILIIPALLILFPKRIPYAAYQAYLKSPKWQALRLKRLEIDNYKCQSCFKSLTVSTAHVHHITYKRLRNEKLSDLATVCYKCHMKIHNRS